jgi:circadian clock protein KaiC
MLVVDGFRSIRSASPSDLDLSEFMHSLNALVASMGCTTLLLSPVEGNEPESENTLVDGLIELSQYEQGMRQIREVKVFKMRGARHLLGKHSFEVTHDGVKMYPRLETLSGHKNIAAPAAADYVSCGIPSWDKAIGGGIIRSSVTNLLGSPGVGKTSMALHFIHEGLRENENVLVVGFYESPARLLEKARKLGIDLSRYIDNKQLEIMWHLPLEVLIDRLASEMLENISRRNVTRLVIDGIDGIRNITMHPDRASSFMIALVNELRLRDVTTFITEQLPYFKESIPTASSSSSALYENIMLLEFVEHNDVHHRQISVLKLRENGYDNENHLMIISDHGVEVDGYISQIKKRNEQA